MPHPRSVPAYLFNRRAQVARARLGRLRTLIGVYQGYQTHGLSGVFDDVQLGLVQSDAAVFLPLLNATEVDLLIGDVVAASVNGSGAVEIADDWRSPRRYVVAAETIPKGLPGRFCVEGFHPVNSAQGTSIGQPFTKSATPRAVEGRNFVGSGLIGMRWTLGHFLENSSEAGVRAAYFTGMPEANDNPRFDVTIREDFTSSNLLTVSTGGVVAVYIAQQSWALISNNPNANQAVNGIISVTGDGTLSGRLILALNGASAGAALVIQSPVIMRMRWAQLTATAATRWIGAMSAFAGAEPANGVYFRHTAGGNIFAVCRSGGVETTLDTGIVSGAGTFWDFELRWRSPFAVDVFRLGAYIGTITTNIPVVALGFGAHESVITAGVGLAVDYLEAYADRA